MHRVWWVGAPADAAHLQSRLCVATDSSIIEALPHEAHKRGTRPAALHALDRGRPAAAVAVPGVGRAATRAPDNVAEGRSDGIATMPKETVHPGEMPILEYWSRFLHGVTPRHMAACRYMHTAAYLFGLVGAGRL